MAIGYFVSKEPSKPVSTEPTEPIIKIGLIMPLTGEVASLGENAKNGASLAYNDLPEIIKQKISLIFEDDGFQPKNTVSVFNKLVDNDKVNVVVCFASGPCSAVAPLADQKKIPLMKAIISFKSDGTKAKISTINDICHLHGLEFTDSITSKAL